MTIPVTILLPTYNGEKYLRESMESVLAQTFGDFELLVVDDGSTDGSSAIYDAIALSDERIRIVKQENQGISGALNTGLRLARGEFIARIDSDDLMMPMRLATQVAFLRTHPEYGFCASAMDIIDGDGRVRARYCPVPSSRPELDDLVRAKTLITYTHPTVMMRRDLALTLGGYDARFEPCEDTELFARMIATGKPGIALPEVLTRYRMHDGSISGRRAFRQIYVSELVRTNLYAQIEGRPRIAPDEWDAILQSQPAFTRVTRYLRMRSQALRQMARYEDVSGRRWSARLTFLLSVGLRPAAVLRALRSKAARLASTDTPPSPRWLRQPF